MKGISLLFFIVLFVSCSERGDNNRAKQVKADPSIREVLWEQLDLEKEVIATPSAVIGITDPIDIRFREPVIPSHLVGTVLDKNPFSFDPPLKGSAQWLSTTLLRFTPHGELPAGKEVHGVLHGAIAFGEQGSVNDLQFSFKVAEQEVLSLEGDFEPAPETEQGVRWNGVLTFAQPVDEDEVAKDLRFKGPDGRVEVNVKTMSDNTRLSVQTEAMIRERKGKTYTVTLPRRYTANDDSWTKTLYLPPLNVFRVMAHMDMSEPGTETATYGFRFSEPIRTGMDLSGFVSVSPYVSYSVRIKDKFLLLEGRFVPGIRYSVTIAEGFLSAYETKLADSYSVDFSLDNTKPAVEWLSEGVYLPTDNNFKLQFKSVNVSKVRVAVTEIYPQNIGFFLQNNALRDKSNQVARHGRYGGSRYQDLQ
ncbi:MAG: hypothetical protein GF344_21030, partial [Chitinivibrionales bacterium]|nr:hypothetical protein [Chitinivibrionales bacterium]